MASGRTLDRGVAVGGIRQAIRARRCEEDVPLRPRAAKPSEPAMSSKGVRSARAQACWYEKDVPSYHPVSKPSSVQEVDSAKFGAERRVCRCSTRSRSH